MFASNFPVDGLKGSWDYLMSQFKRAVADLPLADRRKLFADNAARFYRIDLGQLAARGIRPPERKAEQRPVGQCEHHHDYRQRQHREAQLRCGSDVAKSSAFLAWISAQAKTNT